MKKIIVLIMTIVMVLALTACGSSGDTTPAGSTQADAAPAASGEPVDAEITESGYKLDDGYLFYAVKLHNPNADYAIELPSYRVTAKDESGTVLGTMDHTLSVIYPGQDFYFASQGFSCDEEPATVSFEIIPSDEYKFIKVSSLDHKDYQPLEVIGANVKDDEFMPSVLGEVKNNNDYDIESVVVVVCFRDADGNLVGGTDTFVDHVPAGGTVAFDIGIYSDIATDNFEVYANNWE